MKLKNKTALLTGTFVITLLVVSTIISIYAFRSFAIYTAQEHSRTAAEIVRVSMTEAMVNGVINKRDSFLARIATVAGLQGARIVPSSHVINQFGNKNEHKPDEIDAQVLKDGQAFYQLDDEKLIVRSTIPYIANEGDNCLGCHLVPAGTVLGVVTITISIDELQQQGVKTIIVTFSILSAISLLFLFFFRWQLNPIINTAQGVQEIVKRARVGEFSRRIEHEGNDEIAQIASDINKLLGHLEDQLGETCRDVARLMKYELPSDVNLLQTTTEMVSGLIEVSQFKLDIEEDQSKQEVYNRISRVLFNKFNIKNLSIYEASSTKNAMIPMVVDNQANAECRWCDKSILEKADGCRALRTGHIIDSVAKPDICDRFCNNENKSLQHICMPVIQTGAVGSVVQLAFEAEQSQHVYSVLPLILVYLRESSSVVEAKRLMDTLRETTLRDAMTGLRNRRFLEEYMTTLVATVHRKKQRLSILMMDLDKFKHVNDTYGHDAGDTVLKMLSAKLESQVRSADIVIRYGGEEFMVILQETTDGSYCGEIIAEKIRAAVQEMEINIPGNILHKTISIGVATFPEDNEDFWEVVKFADEALFEAKESGRNKVIRWHKETTTA